jgi:hypothetical protein
MSLSAYGLVLVLTNIPKEFGIDIVGEDNKTIIHDKVAARVVCVTSEHDAQVAARADAHEQQQQRQQYMQQAHAAVAVGNQGSMAHAGPSGINAASQGQPGSAGVGPGPYSSLFGSKTSLARSAGSRWDGRQNGSFLSCHSWSFTRRTAEKQTAGT